MGASAIVISSSEINVSELKNFVYELGGTLVPQENESFVITDGEADVWLAIQDREFASAFYDDETIKSWTKELGASPKTIIELQLDHSALSKQLYVYIAYKCGQKWNVILDDIDDSVQPYHSIISRYENNNFGLSIDKK